MCTYLSVFGLCLSQVCSGEHSEGVERVCVCVSGSRRSDSCRGEQLNPSIFHGGAQCQEQGFWPSRAGLLWTAGAAGTPSAHFVPSQTTQSSSGKPLDLLGLDKNTAGLAEPTGIPWEMKGKDMSHLAGQYKGVSIRQYARYKWLSCLASMILAARVRALAANEKS